MLERLKKETKRWAPSVALFGIATALLLNNKIVFAAIFGGLGYLARPGKESASASHSTHKSIGSHRAYESASLRQAYGEAA